MEQSPHTALSRGLQERLYILSDPHFLMLFLILPCSPKTMCGRLRY